MPPPNQIAEIPPDFVKHPAEGGVCHDYVGDRIGVPSPKPGSQRSAQDITAFVTDKNNRYSEGKPGDKLPAGTVIQLGGAHVGIVGPDGRIYHFTKAAPHALGPDGKINPIPARPNVSNSLNDFVNTPSPDGSGRQPYKNVTPLIWVPPSAK